MADDDLTPPDEPPIPPGDDLPPTGEHRIFGDDFAADFDDDRPSEQPSEDPDASDPDAHRYPPRPGEPEPSQDTPAAAREQTPWSFPRRSRAEDHEDEQPATGEPADRDEPLDSGEHAGFAPGEPGDERYSPGDLAAADDDDDGLSTVGEDSDEELDRSEEHDIAFVEELEAQAPDLIPTGEEHTPDEIHERRVASHKRHRRNGRIRLLVFVVIIALIVAFVVKGLPGGGHKAKSPTSKPHGSPVAAAGKGPSHLSAGTASALPGNLLIADRGNHRLVVVSPAGQVVWQYPGAATSLTHELLPDFAFFTASGHEIAITEEGAAVIDVLDIKLGQTIYRYGAYDVPGSSANRLSDPSAAVRLATGQILAADIRNCRVVVIAPPAQHVAHQLGKTGRCTHHPPTTLEDPTTAFPTADGGIIVNELTAHADLFNHAGKLIKTLRPPGFTHTSMTAEVRSGVYISVEHTHPGSVEEFTSAGKVLWHYTVKKGPGELADPSLATVLPSGDVLVSDDYNDRVIVIDPHTDAIVWQYGHPGKAGSGPGYLDLPVGIDLVKPYSLLDKFPSAAPPK